jgi:hypothetical protein
MIDDNLKAQVFVGLLSGHYFRVTWHQEVLAIVWGATLYICI